MEILEIKILLEKFYEGKTSVEEEQTLKKYFAQAQIDDTLKADKMVFEAMYANEAEIEMPNNLIAKISTAIDGKATDATKIVNICPDFLRNAIGWIWISASAAILIIAFSLFGIKNNAQEPLFIANTSISKEQAVDHARQALELVSDKISNGLKPINATNEKIEKSLQPLKNTENRMNAINEKLNNVILKKI